MNSWNPYRLVTLFVAVVALVVVFSIIPAQAPPPDSCSPWPECRNGGGGGGSGGEEVQKVLPVKVTMDDMTDMSGNFTDTILGDTTLILDAAPPNPNGADTAVCEDPTNGPCPYVDDVDLISAEMPIPTNHGEFGLWIGPKSARRLYVSLGDAVTTDCPFGELGCVVDAIGVLRECPFRNAMRSDPDGMPAPAVCGGFPDGGVTVRAREAFCPRPDGSIPENLCTDVCEYIGPEHLTPDPDGVCIDESLRRSLRRVRSVASSGGLLFGILKGTGKKTRGFTFIFNPTSMDDTCPPNDDVINGVTVNVGFLRILGHDTTPDGVQNIGRWQIGTFRLVGGSLDSHPTQARLVEQVGGGPAICRGIFEITFGYTIEPE